MTFADFNLNKPLYNALTELNIVEPTRIQEKVFSITMSGRDVVGIAQTGTGKTFAYLLPILRLWQYPKTPTTSVLILVPTRELVKQVVDEVTKLAKYTNLRVLGVYGGTNINTQVNAIIDRPDIVVATPGRLYDIAIKGAMKLQTIKKLVIDEVDEMLSLGFRMQLNRIFDLLPERRQNLMFSATLTDDVDELIKSHFHNPEKIEAAPTGTPLENIEQQAFNVPNFYTKINFLRYLLSTDSSYSKVLVFTGSKRLADEVFNELNADFPEEVGVIHSNKDVNNRFNTVRKFKSGEYSTIIATDLISRGLDISEVSHVINFDIPTVPETYMHRIGRTGRADSNGIALSFFTERDGNLRQNIEGLMRYEIPDFQLPEAVEISDMLTEDEMPKQFVPNVKLKKDTREVGPAFHEKLEKNKKTNSKVPYSQIVKEKYKKPKTRGQKPRGKKK